MGKILDLRKKPVKSSKTLQKSREQIKIEQKNFQEEKSYVYWEAPSFYYNPQKRYLSLVIVALLTGAIALLIFKYDVLVSIFLILSSAVLLLYSKQKPTKSKITVDQSGIWVDNIMYYYKDLRSFWIEYNPGGSKELSLESTKWYMPYVKILLNNQNPVEVRSLIINFLPEKEHENSLIDYVGRKLGL